MLCEMCGNKESTAIAFVEGVELRTCLTCTRFGKVVKQLRQQNIAYVKKEPKKEDKEKIYLMISGYNNTIKKARERLGLKQEEVALKMAEKESVLNKVESGHHEPDVELAKKLEKFFQIKIIEEVESSKNVQEEIKRGKDLTIGDMVNIKKRSP